MSVSRRRFLKAGSLVALAAVIPISVFGQSRKENDGNPIDPTDQQPVQSDPLAQYNRSAFASYVNSIFQLYTGYSVVEVALVEVKDLLPAQTARDGRECFSLLFRGGSTALRQNTYRIDHPSLGSFKMFLVPGGPDDNGAQSFVAIINRLSYSDALAPAPVGSEGTKRSGSMTPTTTPTPTTTTPTPTNALPSAPARPAAPTITKPAANPKPVRRKKPSWKSGDNEDFEGGIDQ